MKAKQLLTIAVVSTLLLGGMAALGAATPADGAAENATDAHGENTPDDPGNETGDARADRAGDSEERAGDAGDRAGDADSVGPSDGLPEQVPDHVGEIHDRIDSFLNGSIDDLGESLSELNSDGEAADEGGETEESDENAS